MATSFLGLPTVSAGTLIKATDWNNMVNKLDAAIKKIMVVEKLVKSVYISYVMRNRSEVISAPASWDFVEFVPMDGESGLMKSSPSVKVLKNSGYMYNGRIQVNNNDIILNASSENSLMLYMMINFYKYEAVSV